jgi:spore coat polysaccharide biosynthesis protein SpsF (cytidylyltransferase family)
MNKKKIGIIIEARTGSKRLPSKILNKVNGITILEYLILRVRKQKFIKEIIVATSYLKEDDLIIDICKKNKVKYFRGDKNNLIKRVSSAATEFAITDIVQLTSDNPLVDLSTLKKLYDIYIKNNYDIVSNSFVRTYPIGSDIRIFSLSKLIQNSKKVIGKNRQHTCYFFLKNLKKLKTFNLVAEKKLNRPDLRITLDYKEDFIVLKEIIYKLAKNNE